MGSNKHSIVEYYGLHDNYRCGYCKNPNSNSSHGMWAHTLTVSDYQNLIDRGWRRSGQYCYKPTMDTTCCPMYTIRCDIKNFKPTKSQKKVMKKFNRYLIGQTELEKKMDTAITCEDSGGDHYVEPSKSHQKIDVQNVISSGEKSDMMESDVDEEVLINGTTTAANPEKKEVLSIGESVSKEIKKGAGFNPQKGPCKKAKLLRKERKLEKMKQKGIDPAAGDSSKNKNQEKQLEDFINDLPEDLKHKLEIKLVRTAPAGAAWLATARQTYEVYVKYQAAVHADRPEKFSQFSNFLVQSPLLEEYSAAGPACGYGSFHQQYWLDGRLAAVGVLDVLPKCVSSVYFFYDPEFMPLTLGTYGALREIAFTRHLRSLAPGIQSYYMGYYIHSCRKMRYKGNYYPSALLCPETYRWCPLADCVPKLEATPYARLDPDLDSLDEDAPTEADVDLIPVLVGGVRLRYKVYRTKMPHDSREDAAEYAALVGATAAKKLILVK